VIAVAAALRRSDLERVGQAFDKCQPFKDCYIVDRDAAPPQIGKRHRNRINKALAECEVREVDFADHLPRWLEL
jgi:hypothetical protein